MGTAEEEGRAPYDTGLCGAAWSTRHDMTDINIHYVYGNSAGGQAKSTGQCPISRWLYGRFGVIISLLSAIRTIRAGLPGRKAEAASPHQPGGSLDITTTALGTVGADE